MTLTVNGPGLLGGSSTAKPSDEALDHTANDNSESSPLNPMIDDNSAIVFDPIKVHSPPASKSDLIDDKQLI